MQKRIGFIGQGFVGAATAKDYDARGFSVVRYQKGVSYRESKRSLAACDIVFIAVPTPTTPKGFNAGVVREVMKLIAPGTVAVIKSTVLPGITESIQAENPEVTVFFSPEFLSAATAEHDAANPPRNIIGVPIDTPEYRERARDVLDTFPKAPFELICSSREAELIKYAKNTLGYFRILHTNLMYEMSEALGASWDPIKSAMTVDPDIPGDRYLSPVHHSGRGAGGACFIKDFEAFLTEYERRTGDLRGVSLLRAMREKNLTLLRSSDKDQDIVAGVYGA